MAIDKHVLFKILFFSLRNWFREIGTRPVVLDKNTLIELSQFTMAEQSLAQILIKEFIKTAPHYFDQILQAIQNNEIDKFKMAAHKLRTLSATLGLNRIALNCKKIEMLVDLPEQNSSYIKRLEMEIKQAIMELDPLKVENVLHK